MITTALLILDLGLVAGQDFVTIAAVIGADGMLPPPFYPPPVLRDHSLCDCTALSKVIYNLHTHTRCKIIYN